MAEVIQIDSKTWRFEDRFVRFFLLVGEDKAVLIDSGINCPDALDMAKKLTDVPILLLNTHGDGDHASGTGSFSEIYMHESDYDAFRISARFPNTKLVPICDGDVIDLGNRPLKIIHIPGHTRGSVAILDAKARVLYAGDSVQKGNIIMFGSHRDIDLYESSLDKLISLTNEYDNIYASHDEWTVPNDYALKVKNAWKQVRSGVVDYEIIDLFGSEVKLYTTDVCDFFVE